MVRTMYSTWGFPVFLSIWTTSLSVSLETTNDAFIQCFKEVCSSAPLIGTPLLPNGCVLIRKVSFGERQHIHSQYLLPRMCVLYKGVSSLESVL